jgi:peptide/nickel transport system permease protein
VTSGWPRFVLSRLVRLVVVTLVLVTVVFVAVRLVPGDPAIKAVGTMGELSPAEQQRVIQRTRDDLHLDDALPVQYGKAIVSAVTFDFGTSVEKRQPVRTVVGDRVGSTLRLALAGTIVVLGLALPLGMIVGFLTDGRRKGLEMGFSAGTGFVGSIPPYVMAILLIFVFAYSLQWFPRIPQGGWMDEVLPALAVGLGPALLLARMVRVETLGVLAQDYLRTARSKRLPSRRVLLRDVLPNVVTPALTIAGVIFSSLVGGAVVVEGIFNRRGLGTALITAVQVGDYPVVQAIAIFLGFTVVVVNTFVDVAIAAIDPRSAVTA